MGVFDSAAVTSNLQGAALWSAFGQSEEEKQREKKRERWEKDKKRKAAYKKKQDALKRDQGECRTQRLDMNEYVQCVWADKKRTMPRRYKKHLPECAYLYDKGKDTSDGSIRTFDFCIKQGKERLQNAQKAGKRMGIKDMINGFKANSIKHTCPSHKKVQIAQGEELNLDNLVRL